MIAVLVLIREVDTLFKNVIIQSTLPYLKDVRLFFVYGNNGNSILEVRERETFTDIYTCYPETFENIIHKGVDGLQVVINMCSPEFIIRTNMSTLVDFEKVIKYVKKLPKRDFYGGPFIGQLGIKPLISGTCILMSLDMAKYIVVNRDKIDTSLNEDVGLSNLVDTTPHLTINIKRIDFIDNKVLFHKCTVGDDSVFLFRFKSNYRTYDSELMRKVLESRKNLHTIYEKFDISSELSIYSELFSNTPFLV
jgi:hypothetical protein